MIGYLVDPSSKTITEVEHKGKYKDIYTYIKGSCFDCAYFNKHNDVIFVENEGSSQLEQSFFSIPGYDSPLAGKGLILGCDNIGQTRSPIVTMEWLKQSVKFLSPEG